jgi:type IV secretory pathway TrbF-like protein
MVEILMPSAVQMRLGLIQNTIKTVFGPGTYWVHIRDDLDPWLVAIIYPGQAQAITGPITPDEAADERCRRILAAELRNKARTLGWLEAG